MSDGIQLIIREDGTAEKYDDTYDLTIHCTSEDEQREVLKIMVVAAKLRKPHGALIDRDAFKADFSMGENCDKCGIVLKSCEYDRIYTKMDFCGWLDDAPVIIEAEGSGENV